VRILVFDVPAETGGALAILEEWHRKAVQDSSNSWLFVVSWPQLYETSNVKILRYPWVKRSWLHRLYFDYFVAPGLVAKYAPDEILSLQNVTIPRTAVPQTLYVHHAVAFIDRRFRLIESPRLWVYQNIIGRRIFYSIKRANKVLVQSSWMRDACIKKTGIKPEKVLVMQPSVPVEDIVGVFEGTESSYKTFFYPASGSFYKNHKLVVDAAQLLDKRGVKDYTIIFTLRGDESRNVARLYETVKRLGLPIEFIGPISRKQVFTYYTRSILVFPSYCETFGLPLLEARLHGCPILAPDCPFAHEILEGYDKAFFFRVDDAGTLADLMAKCISMTLFKPAHSVRL